MYSECYARQFQRDFKLSKNNKLSCRIVAICSHVTRYATSYKEYGTLVILQTCAKIMISPMLIEIENVLILVLWVLWAKALRADDFPYQSKDSTGLCTKLLVGRY